MGSLGRRRGVVLAQNFSLLLGAMVVLFLLGEVTIRGTISSGLLDWGSCAKLNRYASTMDQNYTLAPNRECISKHGVPGYDSCVDWLYPQRPVRGVPGRRGG